MSLWLVATPIGTMSDCSPRAQQILGTVDLVCAEDTRTTGRLLAALGVRAKELRALHAHNEDKLAEAIAARAADQEVALVSDAGTPGISDPGRALVQACHAAGVQVLSVPGPSALAAALASSGFPAAMSTFLGFAPRKGREGWTREVLGRPETLVIYEAPGRITDLVRRLAEVDPEREACLCREISKRYEENLRLPLKGLAEDLAGRDVVKGECVLVIGPGQRKTATAAATEQVAEGAGLKQVAAVLAGRWGVKKREAYQALLELERELRDV